MDLNFKKEHKEALNQFIISFNLGVEQNDLELIHGAEIEYKLKKEELLKQVDSFYDEQITSVKKEFNDAIRQHDEIYNALVYKAQQNMDAAIQAAKDKYGLTTATAKQEHKNKTRPLVQRFEKNLSGLENSRNVQKSLVSKLFKTKTVNLRDKHILRKVNKSPLEEVA